MNDLRRKTKPDKPDSKPRRHTRGVIRLVHFRALQEQLRSSLFFVPALYVAGSVMLALLLGGIDGTYTVTQHGLFPRTTVANARALLSTVAGAIITVSGLVFSLSIVAVQLAASQYSPRVLSIFYHSRFQQSIMGYMAATFTYCLVALNAIHAPFNGSDQTIIPSLTAAVGLLLAVGAILAILAYVNYIAQNMEPGQIIRHIADESMTAISRLDSAATEPAPEAGERPTDGRGCVIRASGSGWVQQANSVALLDALPPGSTIWLDVRPGTFVSPGLPLCTVWPEPENAAEIAQSIRATIVLGRARTMQEDLAYGIRQLVDIAAQALSPGINAPTTAYQAVAHLGMVLRELLVHELPPTVIADCQGRLLVRTRELTYGEYVNRAFDQVSEFGASQPEINITVLKTLGRLRRAVIEAGHPERVIPLQNQAALVLAGCAHASLLPAYLERVRTVARMEGFAIAEDQDRDGV